MSPEDLMQKIAATPFVGRRRLIALVGPPASGKSTLAKALAAIDPHNSVVPMDGFHLDNSLLELRGLLKRKGAPETFDVAGFLHLVQRLRTEDEVIYPLFNRSLDASINAAGHIGPDTKTIIVEGNYLLLNQPIWQDLAPFWDLSVRLQVDETTLQERLIQRWRTHGLSDANAVDRAHSNDLPNARLVQNNSQPADITIHQAPR